MKTNDIQFLYPKRAFESSAFLPEIEAFRNFGFIVENNPQEDAQLILYRGFILWKQSDYPIDKRIWQGWKEYQATSLLSIYYPLIADICIPTFFVDELDQKVIKREMEKRKLECVFIKNDVKSLFCIDETASVYPKHSLLEIKENLDKYPPFEGAKYAIRQYVDADWTQEDRYFVINDRIFHRSGIIPPVVQEAAKRLKPLGSHYYVIDAMPDFIVEVNPGESSDRYGDNPPELFASWFKQALSSL